MMQKYQNMLMIDLIDVCKNSIFNRKFFGLKFIILQPHNVVKSFNQIINSKVMSTIDRYSLQLSPRPSPLSLSVTFQECKHTTAFYYFLSQQISLSPTFK